MDSRALNTFYVHTICIGHIHMNMCVHICQILQNFSSLFSLFRSEMIALTFSYFIAHEYIRIVLTQLLVIVNKTLINIYLYVYLGIYVDTHHIIHIS